MSAPTVSRVLVTGASGFIGSHLVERLARDGRRVRALVHYRADGGWGNLEHLPGRILERIEVVPGDIRDPILAREVVRGCDAAFHLAALVAIPFSYRAPQAFVDTNVLGTLNVLQACLEAGVRRLVHTSTSEVYGTPGTVPITEAHPLGAQSPYAASKVAADQMALAYHRSFGLPVVVLRPFNTYGPRQSARAVIPTLLGQVLSGRSVRLGATSPTRDFLYVSDTVEAFVRAAFARGIEGEVIQVGTGVETSIGELAERVLGGRGRIVRDRARVRPAASEVERLVCDWSKARRLMGWAPRVPLAEGLKRTGAWLRAHRPRRPGRYAF